MLDFQTVGQWIAIGTSHQYLALAIAIIGWLTSLTSSWSKFPITVPTRYQPLIAIGLGAIYGVLLDHQNGHSWGVAIVSGLAVGLATSGMYDAVIKAVYDGKIPSWLATISFAHKKPVIASPPSEESVSEPTLIPVVEEHTDETPALPVTPPEGTKKVQF